MSLQARLDTTSTCQLAVSNFPMFSYNADGGGGNAVVTTEDGRKLHLEFDAAGVLVS